MTSLSTSHDAQDRRLEPAAAQHPRFDAFVSYSHTADGKLGPSLRDGLHDFNRPWLRPRQLRVFCDTRSLSSSPDLWKSIVEALDSSAHLILLASPESARAPWVRREVGHWVSAGRPPPLIILTGGMITWDAGARDFDWVETTALPEELRGVFSAGPAWIDVRSMSVRAGEMGSSRDPVFVDAVASIASVLQGRPKDELIGEDIANHRRALRFRRLTWSALVMLTVVALVLAGLAVGQR